MPRSPTPRRRGKHKVVNKTALITGITGQDGSYLAELLLAEGYRVVGMTRRTSTDVHERIQHIFDDKPGHVNPQSAADRDAWIRTFKEVASDPANLREDLAKHFGVDVTVYTQTVEDGAQVWVEVANGRISDAGLNTPGMAR